MDLSKLPIKTKPRNEAVNPKEIFKSLSMLLEGIDWRRVERTSNPQLMV